MSTTTSSTSSSSTEELPDNIQALNNSNFSNLIRDLPLSANNNAENATFNWINSNQFGLNNTRILVPKCLDQRNLENCVVCGTYTLMQFQINLVCHQRGVRPPKLSLKYMNRVFYQIPEEERYLSTYLHLIAAQGVIAEKDYIWRRGEVKPGAMRYYLDWHYGFRVDEEDFERRLREVIIQCGGCLADLRYTKDFFEQPGREIYRAQDDVLLDPKTDQELSHIVAMFGWKTRGAECLFEFMNSHGAKYGIGIGNRKGCKRAVGDTIYRIYVPQVRLWDMNA